MMRARVAAFVSFLGLLVLAGTPAWATDGPDYPPTPEATSASVGGVQAGVGAAGTNTGSTLPHTGLDPAFLVVGVLVLLIGVALVLVSRRRAH